MIIYRFVFSTGIGKSGTFMAVDVMLTQIKLDKQIDLFRYVALMRSNRMDMVPLVVSLSQ